MAITLLEGSTDDGLKLVIGDLPLCDDARALELVESGRATKVILRSEFEAASCEQ